MCWRSWSVFPWRKPSWALRYDFVETPRLCHHCKEDCGQVYLIILILFAASMFIVICCYLVSMESEEVGLKGHPCFTSMVIMIASNSLLDTELIPTLAHIVYMSLTSRENLVCRVFVGDVPMIHCERSCRSLESIQNKHSFCAFAWSKVCNVRKFSEQLAWRNQGINWIFNRIEEREIYR